MSKEALKLALEALESAEPKYTKQRADQKTLGGSLDYWKLAQHQRMKAITAIKEALAQPEQEPLACVGPWHDGRLTLIPRYSHQTFERDQPLYTTPPQPKEPEQEPVAWMRDDEMKAMVSDEKRAWILCGRSELIEEYNKPLYTTPPQRTWVGLTDEERNDCLVSADPCEALAEPEARQLMEDIEAKLKELNNG